MAERNLSIVGDIFGTEPDWSSPGFSQYNSPDRIDLLSRRNSLFEQYLTLNCLSDFHWLVEDTWSWLDDLFWKGSLSLDRRLLEQREYSPVSTKSQAWKWRSIRTNVRGDLPDRKLRNPFLNHFSMRRDLFGCLDGRWSFWKIPMFLVARDKSASDEDDHDHRDRRYGHHRYPECQRWRTPRDRQTYASLLSNSRWIDSSLWTHKSRWDCLRGRNWVSEWKELLVSDSKTHPANLEKYQMAGMEIVESSHLECPRSEERRRIRVGTGWWSTVSDDWRYNDEYYCKSLLDGWSILAMSVVNWYRDGKTYYECISRRWSARRTCFSRISTSTWTHGKGSNRRDCNDKVE